MRFYILLLGVIVFLLGFSPAIAESSNLILKVVGDTVNLREAEGKSSKVLGTLKFGDKVSYLGISSAIELINGAEAPWVRVKTTEGMEGFIFGSLLMVHETNGSPSPYIDYIARPRVYKSKNDLKKTPKESRYIYTRHWFTSKEYSYLKEKGFALTTPRAAGYVSVDDMIDHYIPFSYIRKTEEFIQTYDNDIPEYRVLPLFVTSDYILHCFHLIFDRMLENIEAEKLHPALKELSMLVYKTLLSSYVSEKDSKLKKAKFNAAAFAAVPVALLSDLDPEGGSEPPDISFITDQKLRSTVQSELKFIYSTSGPNENQITGGKSDYSQFTVRGHYTHSPILKSYFRAMIWYGQIYFPLSDRPVEGILIAETFRNANVTKTWDRVNAVIDSLVGRSDDLGPKDYLSATESVFGKGKNISKYPEEEMIQSFIQTVGKLSNSKIVSSPLRGTDGSFASASTLDGFRFMGQRFIIDSRIFTILTSPRVGNDSNSRNFPKGLDLFAVYGSQVAESFLVDDKKSIPRYIENFEKAKKELNSRNLSNPTVYEAWVDLLAYYVQSKEKVSQPFNKSDLWGIRKLLTVHGSWAELRHDTILYSKPSAAEMGGPDGEEIWIPGAPLIPRGYVEPDPEFFGKVTNLISRLRDVCAKENLLSDAYKKITDQFIEITKRLTEISKKQIDGKAFTDDDSIYLGSLNQTLSWIVLPPGISADSMTSEEKQMALIADIHTDNFSGGILHVGVGSPRRIWIYVNDASGARICEGYIFSYYEFVNSKRLTDEEWKETIYNPDKSKENKQKEPKWLNALPFAD